MTRRFKHIAMLSTHGYFDPIPLLGETDTGGQVLYVLELSKALARKGVKVDIYTRWFDHNRLQINPLKDCPDVRVIRIPAGLWEFVIKEEIYELLPELTDNLVSFIRENKLEYDLFHGHYVDAGIVTIEMENIFGKPAFFTAHSLGAWKRERMDGDTDEMETQFHFNHRISEEQRVFRNLRGHTVTSQLQLEKLRELYDYQDNNVEIIPPGVNIHKFKPLVPWDTPRKTGLPDNYIFCLSRVDSNKGYDLLLNAFARVCQQVDDIYLVTGGGSAHPQPREQEVLDMMRRIMKEKHIENKIVFVGHVEEKLMVAYYQNARFFVMPSIFEPFGMTVQEAMASGIPVIASRFGGIKTILTHEQDGLLIDPKNEDEFASTMIRLLKDKPYRDRLGKAASALVRRNFSWEAMADRHLAFYERFC
jgi:mannosylfructose-phosphate synthase